MSKRALLVGIDSYDHMDELSACVKDVEALEPLLKRNEDRSKNFSVITLKSTEKRIDRSCLMRHMRAELESDAKMVLLYFAGHGAQRSGDVVLCTQEGDADDEGVHFSTLLALINDSSVDEVVIILDCCFSGGAGGNPVIGRELSYVRQGVAILTASRHNEVALEDVALKQGRFSYFLCAALSGGAADVLGSVGVIGTYAYLRESFGVGQQRPMFKCNVAELQRLRSCYPAVPHDEIRRLPKLFHTPEHMLKLDPSFERTAKLNHPVNEATFSILQRMRAAKLVEPVGVAHMYDAAMQHGFCQLTILGRHYRHLAEQGLI